VYDVVVKSSLLLAHLLASFLYYLQVTVIKCFTIL